MHINSFSGILADATTSAGAPGTPLNPIQSLVGNPMVFIGLMIVMMYFLLIRPQQQRTKQQAKLLAAIKSGDRVVTASGIVGVIITVKDKTVSLRSADAKFEVTKSSITEILEAGTASES
ncbi:MAG TPA: preprotein translocase subunit YajC [Verrucomicrobiae bacterium]